MLGALETEFVYSVVYSSSGLSYRGQKSLQGNTCYP